MSMSADFPTEEEGNQSRQAGYQHAVSGGRPDDCPHDIRGTSHEKCLAFAWRSGYNWGRQVRMQSKYGDLPDYRPD